MRGESRAAFSRSTALKNETCFLRQFATQISQTSAATDAQLKGIERKKRFIVPLPV